MQPVIVATTLIPKLDKLILKSFIGPFLASFFIALFAVVIQHFWKYIDEMVGKGIDTFTLLKMIGIVSLSIGVMFALPIAILIASLMTFGNLAESFELVAIKSSGISLTRFMRPILVFVLFVCGLSLVFNNYVLPWSNLKFFTMLSDMRTSKPAFDLTPGAFYNDIPGVAIYVDKKDDKTGSLNNVVIYENSGNNLQDNFIVADSGKIKVSPDKLYLDFTLYNGERTQERGDNLEAKAEFIRIRFKELKKSFDISSLIFKATADSNNKGYFKALNISQLNHNIDSLRRTDAEFYKKSKRSQIANFTFLTYLTDSNFVDQKLTNITAKTYKETLPDSVVARNTNEIAEKIYAAKNQLEMDAYEYNAKKDSLRSHKVEWHRKFTFSIIGLVMFLIGAPLGAIIRRGGLGWPLLFGILFFVIYFILFTMGEKNANASKLSPANGMWLPVYVMLPLGLYFVYKARKDANIFSQEFIYKQWKFIKNIGSKIRSFVTRKTVVAKN